MNFKIKHLKLNIFFDILKMHCGNSNFTCLHCGMVNYMSKSIQYRSTIYSKKDTFEMAVKRGDYRKAMRTIQHRRPNTNYIVLAANSLNIPTLQVCLKSGDTLSPNIYINVLEKVLTKKNSFRKTEMIEYLFNKYNDNFIARCELHERDLLLFSVKDLLTLKLLVERYNFNINVLNSNSKNLLMYLISNINDEAKFPECKSMISYVLSRGIDLNYIDAKQTLKFGDLGGNNYLIYLFEYSNNPEHYTLFSDYYISSHFQHINAIGEYPLVKLFKRNCTKDMLDILNILLDVEPLVDFTIIDTRVSSDIYNRNILNIFRWIGMENKEDVLKVTDRLLARGVNPYHITVSATIGGSASIPKKMIDYLPDFIKTHIEETILDIKEPSVE